MRVLLKLLALTMLLTGSAAHAAEQYRWTGVERVVAMSDPHGAYDAMLRTLEEAGLVDGEGAWSGGESHLVITGDLLDRGADSRKVMDLVMRLEEQAIASGGRVHLTLGNHEVMNLVGDLRYVSPEEYAAFAAEESAEERERWFQRLLSTRRVQTAGQVDAEQLRAEFERERPAGFYAHRRALSTTGKYGSWLLQKPFMVVVNDTAYVHGGMPPMVAELGLEKLNEQLPAEVTDYVAALDILFEAGLIDPAVNFYEHGRIAAGIASDATIPAELQRALDTIVELNEAPVHDSSSPLWYRGTVGCSVLAEGDVITAALDAVGAERVVIGHTPTVGREVLQRFDGRVIEIDTGMLSSAYHGSGHALIIEGDSIRVADEAGDGPGVPLAHPRRVGRRADALSAEKLEDLLANGRIIETRREAGRAVVDIELGNTSISAVFRESPRRKGEEPELAAYRLDRLIGADLVPVTVAREVDGDRGTLQFLPGNVRDEAYRSNSGQGGGAWCPLPRQWGSMYIFDALLYNESRTPQSMVYNPSDWQMLSMGHAKAFSTSSGRPAFLAEAPLELTSTWVAALKNLTDEKLDEHLGDVLSKRQISALGKRRDGLLVSAER